MSMKKRRKRVDLPAGNVNITSLLDVLTVLLFFLIQSMSVNSMYLDPPKGIRLPASRITADAEESVRVALSKEALSVDGNVITTLVHGEYQKKDLENDNKTIKALKKILENQLQKKHAFYKDVGDLKNLNPDKVIIQADKQLPFKLVKNMLHTIVVSGYFNYQFVVVPEDKK